MLWDGLYLLPWQCSISVAACQTPHKKLLVCIHSGNFSFYFSVSICGYCYFRVTFQNITFIKAAKLPRLLMYPMHVYVIVNLLNISSFQVQSNSRNWTISADIMLYYWLTKRYASVLFSHYQGSFKSFMQFTEILHSNC